MLDIFEDHPVVAFCELFTRRQKRCASLAKGFCETLLPCLHWKQRGLQQEVGMGSF